MYCGNNSCIQLSFLHWMCNSSQEICREVFKEVVLLLTGQISPVPLAVVGEGELAEETWG